MPKPRVFVSSTFVDLRYVRETVANFINEMGYQPTLFEKGGIGFDYQQPFDESCYEAVEASDILVLIIGGRYGSKASDAEMKSRLNKYNSVTRKEYIRARDIGIPIYIFVNSDVLSEYKTFSNNRKNKTIKYSHVDNPLIFDLIDDIFRQKLNNYITQFNDADDICKALRDQWASFLQIQIKRRARSERPDTVKMNAFKLFYYRKRSGKTIIQLASIIGCETDVLSGLERLKYSKSEFTGYHVRYFPQCDFTLLAKIEAALNCVGKLVAGQEDDFLALYLEYYLQNRGNIAKTHKPRHPMLNFSTKVVIFDFDGTIAMGEQGRTTWESLWVALGYTVNDCAKYHSQFRKGLLKHEEWCALTLNEFSKKDMTVKHLHDVAQSHKIMTGFTEVVDILYSRGVKLYILSGSIREIIQLSIGALTSRFDEIKANEMRFDAAGKLERIDGTKYDFEGKKDFIKRIVKERSCSPMDILFVGNAGNDAWASQSGARTLCVNPTSTDPDNPKQWTYSIKIMSDMRDILPYTN
ncbi:phosphoserine phosphatase [Rhizobium sp. PP-F2F-G48]|uniref:DUF4062 domain-containing protein n=1 Tax=Rhizobium sp. PP-F2F-G48 TaxID=2135651 RepID=UPI00104E0916|nr:DUF4062 domain-containing protein [Rhizobium sp. PP-F2F-G48]TCM51097.1 phosphoserine phosphatase [Rhizobium sp. PP-F2F-G48]